MTFLAEVCTKTLLKMQMQHISFENQIIGLRINTVSKQMQAIMDEYQIGDDSSTDYENDPYYRDLQRWSELFENQQEANNNQIELINAEINSLDNLIKNGIKSSCGLTLSGGS